MQYGLNAIRLDFDKESTQNPLQNFDSMTADLLVLSLTKLNVTDVTELLIFHVLSGRDEVA